MIVPYTNLLRSVPLPHTLQFILLQILGYHFRSVVSHSSIILGHSTSMNRSFPIMLLSKMLCLCQRRHTCTNRHCMPLCSRDSNTIGSVVCSLCSCTCTLQLHVLVVYLQYTLFHVCHLSDSFELRNISLYMYAYGKLFLPFCIPRIVYLPRLDRTIMWASGGLH